MYSPDDIWIELSIDPKLSLDPQLGIVTGPQYDICFDFHIGSQLLPQALDALKSDSQKGTFGKRGDKPKVDPAYLDQADKVHSR